MSCLFVATQVQVDISDPTHVPVVDAMCDDSGTRVVELTLLQDGKPWVVPSGIVASVCYVLPDGSKGEYCTCAGGTPAVSIEDNRAAVWLIGSVLCVPGTVCAYLVLTNNCADGALYIPFNVNVVELI